MLINFLILVYTFNSFHIDKEKLHDFHVSRCEINYETSSGDIQIAAHIFMDDLENAIGLTGIKGLYMGTEKESPDCDDVIGKYVNNKLSIKANGKIRSAQMLGKEISKDKIAIWCYLEIAGVKGLKSLHMENKILTELFYDQKNIVELTLDKKRKFFTVFDTKKVSETYNF